MDTHLEPLSAVPVGGKVQWLRRRPLVVAVAVVGVVVAATALTAAFLLAATGAGSDWIPVYQDVLKTSFGALAVGALGGLAKLIYEQGKAREATETELRDRVGFISTLIELHRDIDTARLLTRVNRSVKNWTAMVNPGLS
jgi:hypothetical protein